MALLPHALELGSPSAMSVAKHVSLSTKAPAPHPPAQMVVFTSVASAVLRIMARRHARSPRDPARRVCSPLHALPPAGANACIPVPCWSQLLRRRSPPRLLHLISLILPYSLLVHHHPCTLIPILVAIHIILMHLLPLPSLPLSYSQPGAIISPTTLTLYL